MTPAVGPTHRVDEERAFPYLDYGYLPIGAKLFNTVVVRMKDFVGTR